MDPEPFITTLADLLSGEYRPKPAEPEHVKEPVPVQPSLTDEEKRLAVAIQENRSVSPDAAADVVKWLRVPKK